MQKAGGENSNPSPPTGRSMLRYSGRNQLSFCSVAANSGKSPSGEKSENSIDFIMLDTCLANTEENVKVKRTTWREFVMAA